MADEPEIIRRIGAALNAKGARGSCPMCRQRQWMIQDESPYSRVGVSDGRFLDLGIFKCVIPAYWLHCEDCRFVAQFMKSIVDNEGTSEPAEAVPSAEATR